MRRIPSFLALRAFEAAARHGSFALASEELHLTPSAISHQVRALEEHFGRALFVRRSRQVELTADGLHLRGHLTPAFDAIEAGCQELSQSRPSAELAVHCAPSLASKWLGPRLPDFFRTHPDINLRLSASAEPIDLARDESLDVVIVYGAAPTRRGILAEPLGVELVTALVAPALAATLEAERIDHALRETLTHIESAVNPVLWTDWYAANGLGVPLTRSRPSFDRGALAVSAAVQGIGVVLETTRFAQDELAHGALVPLGGGRFAGVPRVLHHLCYRATQREAPKIAAFRGWLMRATAEEAAG